MDHTRFRAYQAELEHEKQLGLLSAEEYERRMKHLMDVCGACNSWKVKPACFGRFEDFEGLPRCEECAVSEECKTRASERLCSVERKESGMTRLPSTQLDSDKSKQGYKPLVKRKKKIQAPKCFGYKDIFTAPKIVDLGGGYSGVSPYEVDVADRCKNCVLADDCKFETDFRLDEDIDWQLYEELANESRTEHLIKSAREEQERKKGRDAFIVLMVILLILTLVGLFNLSSGSGYGRYDYEDTSYTYGHPYLR